MKEIIMTVISILVVIISFILIGREMKRDDLRTRFYVYNGLAIGFTINAGTWLKLVIL